MQLCKQPRILFSAGSLMVRGTILAAGSMSTQAPHPTPRLALGGSNTYMRTTESAAGSIGCGAWSPGKPMNPNTVCVALTDSTVGFGPARCRCEIQKTSSLNGTGLVRTYTTASYSNNRFPKTQLTLSEW